jgi:PPOX class probable F420-dependent enzyme
MTTPKETQRALQRERLAYITTYNAQGKPGTVPIWFVYDGASAKVYISTGKNSLKARKLQSDPRVALALGRAKGPRVEGEARFCTQEETARRVAGLLNKKYGGYYGSEAEFATRTLHGDGALLEITLA